MEMADSPSAEEDTDEGFVGYPSLPQGIRPQPRPRQYVEPNRSGERLSRRDVARWITRLQPFDFKIVHQPGKHHSHADGLSRRMSRPCKCDTCPECAPLLHQVTAEEEGTVRAITSQEQYVEHFDGYLEPIEDDSALFRDFTDRELSLAIAPELLWYLGHHPEREDEPTPESGKAPSSAEAKQAISRAGLIKQLIDVDSRQACTQTESDDFLKPQPSKTSNQRLSWLLWGKTCPSLSVWTTPVTRTLIVLVLSVLSGPLTSPSRLAHRCRP